MKKTVRIDPLEKNTAAAGDIVTFVIPQGVYDLSSLKFWLTASMNGTGGNQSLPRDVETMIEQLEVYVGDTKVQYTPYYNQLVRILLDYDRNANEVRKRHLLSNSMWINNALGNGTGLNSVSGTLFCMNKWFGFLGCGETVNTSLMGPIRIVMTLAPNNVLLSNITNAVYTLADMHMTLETMDAADYVPKSIEFDNFKTMMQQNNSYQTQTQLNVSTRHLDYLLATFLPSDWKTKAIANTTDNGSSYYFTHGSAGASFPSLGWNFRVNGANVLNYNPNQGAALEYLNSLFPDTGTIIETALNKVGTGVAVSAFTFVRYLWATGIRVDMEARSAVDVMFETMPYTSTSPLLNFTMLIAKCDSVLHFDPKSNSFVLEA